MPEEILVQVRLKNSGKTIFTNEAGAAAMGDEENMVAENMETAEGTATKKLEETMNELETKNGELETVQSEVEELKGQLSVYKTKLDELLEGDAVGAAAEEMMEEQGEASEILENATTTNEAGEEDEAKKEEVMNSLKGLRGSDLHSAVLGAIGVKIESMTPEGMKGAFKAQHQIANSGGGKKTLSGAKMLGGKQIKVENKQFQSRPAHQRLGFPAAE